MKRNRMVALLAVLAVGGMIVAGTSSAQVKEVKNGKPATERTPALKRYEEMRFGMIIHFDMLTLTDLPWYEAIKAPLPPAETYCPTELDVDGWIAAAKAADMRYAVLPAKHWMGFALWDSRHTDYDVASSGNKTDVVAEFVKACRKQGIAPCFVYTLGWDVAHRRDKKMSDDEWYDHANKQLTELLTDYGPITTVWLDGLEMGKVPQARVQKAYDTIKSLQPDCLVVTHSPGASYSRQLQRWPTDIFQPGRNLPPPEGHDPRMEYQGQTYYLPMDSLYTIVKDWYWRPNEQPEPVADLLERYRNTVGRGSNWTLSVGPDRKGKLPAGQLARLMELSKEIKKASGGKP